MTKIMVCEECSDMVVPRGRRNVRWCDCQRHAVWWDDPDKGIIRVYDAWQQNEIKTQRHLDKPAAFLLGISNTIVQYSGQLNRDTIQFLIDSHSDSYLFKQYNSLIVKFRPGESHDSAWALLPFEDEKWVEADAINAQLDDMRQNRYPQLIVYHPADGALPMVVLDGKNKYIPPEFYLEATLSDELPNKEIVQQLHAVENKLLDQHLAGDKYKAYHMSVRKEGWWRNKVIGTANYLYIVGVSLLMTNSVVYLVTKPTGDAVSRSIG